MRRSAWIAMGALACVTSPARAEFPLAGSAWIGPSFGSGRREEIRQFAPMVQLAVQAGWRLALGRTLVAAFEGAGGPVGVLFIPEASHLDLYEHFALTVGPEFAAPRGSGMAVFCRGSLGVGRVTTEGSRSLDALLAGAPPLARRTEYGVALSGSLGLRLVPPPGPLGFRIALQTSQTHARKSNCSTWGVTFGLMLQPLARRRAPPRPA